LRLLMLFMANLQIFSPPGCTDGSCYPATGNLLVGRAANLTATSTCGLQHPENYCIVSHLMDEDKCFTCDSQRPYHPAWNKNSHQVENVIYLKDVRGELTWWQSVNGEESVSIRLNLEAEFHFTHLIMKFKTFRPAVMIIERSSNFGRSWKTYRYFAYNCTIVFPNIPFHAPHRVSDVICEERYSQIEPSSLGEVIYRVLDPSIDVKDPYSQEIQDLLRITNLRINFTKLHTLGDNMLDRGPDVLQKYYYAMYELVVRGSCFCYGHASECVPVPGVAPGEPGMVGELQMTTTDINRNLIFLVILAFLQSSIHGRCVCKHNTEGLNCERCRYFHHDLPWRPAELYNPHRCRACGCDPVGSLDGGVCDSYTDPDGGMIAGQCQCKQNVKGARCDRCKEGFFGLSQNDPQGCQPCNCDPRGIVMLGSPCDQISGDCSCKRYVTGRYCNQCVPEHWGLGNDIFGCRPCRCDFGGAYDNRCSTDDGQCQCRPHLLGRQCADVEPGYFCAPLDFYVYEAEDAPDVKIVHRERIAGRMVTWTGPGFARVKDGAGLVFKIDNIPFAMEYDIMIRYEPEVCTVTSLISGCNAQAFSLTLRYVEMPRPFCFEPKNHYVVSIRFQRHRASHRYLTAYILVDSLVLIPKYTELPGFQGNHPAAKHRREEMVHYMCLESFRILTPLEARCERSPSLSLLPQINPADCDCDPQGSLGAECQRIGGQCPCKPNVMGRRCDQCAPGSFGFGPHGCSACDCHSQGSLSLQCDPVTGQCPCTAGAMGRQCADCERGQWGFPSCRPCQCNGHAETCDSRTGACLGCRDHTAGHLCDRCEDGFFGNPVLGSGERCRPCPCPDIPGSGHFNGESCHVDHASSQVMCRCKQGYAGPRCDRCAAGYFGDLESWGGECRPCQCNGNADVQDPESCDPRTGRCLKCLYNTDGPSCSACKEGYYGNALLRDCRRCTCATAGTRPSHCDGRGCRCDRITGACLCRDNVVGHNCDQCASNYWNFGTDGGCKACDCHPQHSRRPRCNMFTGQCHCRPGFGGRNCSECQQLHWGDPQVRCYECGCDPLGSETQQCERLTGQCLCVEGATGRRCDQCARGFTGGFPKCVRCHPCFDTWDGAVRQLQQDLERIGRKVQDILKTALICAAVRFISSRFHQLVVLLLFCARAEITLINGRLMVPAEELNGTMVMDEQLRRNLTRLEEELRDLIVSSPDQFDKVRKYYQEFQGAEQQCNASVYGPDSPVEHSRVTRRRVEDLLAERQDKFQRTVAAQKKSLAELEEKTQNMDQKVQNLSNKVCGGYGNPNDNGSCPDSPCGGAGCHDNQGRGQCGGEGCGGTLSTALNALKLAKDVTNNITAVKPMKLTKQAVGFTRSFAEEGADPESIEKVAQQVLNISFPVSSSEMAKVVQEIKDSIANLTHVDGIFNDTAVQLQRAKELLRNAQDAKTRAMAVKDISNQTRLAISDSENAIAAAEKALKKAHESLNSTRAVTSEVPQAVSLRKGAGGNTAETI
uniref:Laminin, beta 2-like n=1 Tax=Scleropages formosus TaxID=113540 RepID=A0A8C9W398_SCLFO